MSIRGSEGKGEYGGGKKREERGRVGKSGVQEKRVWKGAGK